MKYILITGAGGGMGHATVLALRNAGYFVIALDKSAVAPAENLMPIIADITDERSLQMAFEQVKKVTDRLYAIVHFAGVYHLDSFVEMSGEQISGMFEVNVFGACRINRIFLPLLTEGSRIVLTTSELAPLTPLPFTGLYAITKSTLDKYAYSLRMELQLLGIQVVVLRPGAVNTGMLGVSTDALSRFCDNTKLYACNARRFRKIVEGVEAKNVQPEKVSRKVCRILQKRNPFYVYRINRNPLLLILNILPQRLQTFIIRCVLK